MKINNRNSGIRYISEEVWEFCSLRQDTISSLVHDIRYAQRPCSRQPVQSPRRDSRRSSRIWRRDRAVPSLRPCRSLTLKQRSALKGKIVIDTSILLSGERREARRRGKKRTGRQGTFGARLLPVQNRTGLNRSI